jgi:hypothetical protein
VIQGKEIRPALGGRRRSDVRVHDVSDGERKESVRVEAGLATACWARPKRTQGRKAGRARGRQAGRTVGLLLDWAESEKRNENPFLFPFPIFQSIFPIGFEFLFCIFKKCTQYKILCSSMNAQSCSYPYI